MACSGVHRVLKGAVLLLALASARTADAETIFGPVGAVTTASARADPVAIGVYGGSNSGGWWGLQGWAIYFPGNTGTFAGALEGTFMAPLTGFGVRLRPFFAAGIAGTHDTVDFHPDAVQPVLSVGALWYLSEKSALTIAGHNGMLGHNDSTRDSRSWSLTVAIGRRF